MKFLFDPNLSSDLVRRLSDLFPRSAHVKDSDMTRYEDSLIWSYARDKGFVIVSKDSDFQQRSLLLGAPPKVVWLRVGNCATKHVEKLLRDADLKSHALTIDGLAVNRSRFCSAVFAASALHDRMGWLGFCSLPFELHYNSSNPLTAEPQRARRRSRRAV